MPYVPASGTATVGVTSVSIVFSVSPPLPWTAGQTITFRVEVKSDGSPVAGQTVNFFYRPPGTTAIYVVAHSTTGSDGVATASWTVPIKTDYHTLACANWEWGAYVAGPNIYDFSNIITGKVAYPTRISISAPESVVVGKPFTITGKLEYESDAGVWSGLAGKTVSIYYDGTLLGQPKTASDGTFSLTAIIPISGTYTLKAVYAGEGF
jgi:hypothetical protein